MRVNLTIPVVCACVATLLILSGCATPRTTAARAKLPSAVAFDKEPAKQRTASTGQAPARQRAPVSQASFDDYPAETAAPAEHHTGDESMVFPDDIGDGAEPRLPDNVQAPTGQQEPGEF